jgi:hypothetical protein
MQCGEGVVPFSRPACGALALREGRMAVQEAVKEDGA